MFTCESSTQVYLFLLRTFVHDAHTVLRLRYLGYDRACNLKPYLEKKARQGGAGAKLLLDRVEFWLMHFTARTIQNLVVYLHPTLNASSILLFQSSGKYMELTQRAVNRDFVD